MADLKSCRLFEGLSDKELKAVTADLRELEQPAGRQLAVRGAEGVGFMVILDGEVEVTTAAGRQRTLGPGDYFGEMALLDHQARSATVVAKTNVRLAGIPEWSFKSFLTSHPAVMYRLLETMSARLREAEGA